MVTQGKRKQKTDCSMFLMFSIFSLLGELCMLDEIRRASLYLFYYISMSANAAGQTLRGKGRYFKYYELVAT